MALTSTLRMISADRCKLVDPQKKTVQIETASGKDPEAGCGCGENCTRGAGDPCPIAAMPVWEVLFPGWDPEKGPDHLVKWVKADTAQMVGRYLANRYPRHALGCTIVETTLSGIGFEHGLDLVIDESGPWFGENLGDIGNPRIMAKLSEDSNERRMTHLRVEIVARFL